ncbi:hypothetical protein CPB84DRAFT_1772996 [Gymnopilus junonius]|uniref:RanBD1 domain-containing protein n=1 Tax=Gymnopilus junonius TaxID=109634 RepID=A0A9P5NPT6_GYMJU|nr:hypothetical protein CPB84DRAFT_1772996 [Gymnopilus junonius]
MKRQAEKQLIKGDDEFEIDEDSPSQGFKKADEAVLATRVIRGLPKRAGARAPQEVQSNTASATSATNPPSFFSATSSTASNSFEFETTSVSAAPTAPAFSAPSFPAFTFDRTTAVGTPDKPLTPNPFVPPSSSALPTAPAKPTFGFTPGLMPSLPTMSPTATSTSKAFAASLSSSASSFSPNPAPAPVSFTPKPAASGVPSDSAALKYYTDLRGLNISILSAISKTVEEDPFFDITTLLENYKSFRIKIQEDFDKTGDKAGTKDNLTSQTASTVSSQADKIMMPAPPPSFSGFDAFKPLAPLAPSTNEAKPNFPDFKSSSTSSSNASSPFAPLKDSKSSGAPFGASPFLLGTTSGTSSSGASSSPFTFGAQSNPTTSQTANPFGTFGTKPSSFSFGTTSSQPSGTAPKTDFGSSSNPFAFGSTSSTSSSPSSIFGKSESKDSSPFGKPATKSPIHFGFGSAPAPTDSDSAKPLTGDKLPEGESSERVTPIGEAEGGTEAQPALLSTNPHDEDGEGEENEDTVHSIKSKVLRFDDNKWVSYGVGLLKVKKNKDSEARRLLMRNSSTGNVVLNFRLYGGLKLTQDTDQPNTLKFIGHEGGVSQPYSVKVKTKENAAELKNILEREITFVKAKEES